MKLGSQQQEALDSILKFVKSKKLCYTLSGYAGTGKSTIVNEIIDEEEKNRKNEEGGAQMPNTNDMMKNASNMTSNLGNFNFPKF